MRAICPDLMPALARVPVPVVVDHMGRLEHHHGTHNPGFQALLRGVGEGRLWAKLSGTYRLGATPPDYAQARPFHDALLAANPQNLVWGTDWPHPRPEGPVPDAARLLQVFLDWTKDAGSGRRSSPTIRRGFTIFRKRERHQSPPRFAESERPTPARQFKCRRHAAAAARRNCPASSSAAA